MQSDNRAEESGIDNLGALETRVSGQVEKQAVSFVVRKDISLATALNSFVSNVEGEAIIVVTAELDIK